MQLLEDKAIQQQRGPWARQDAGVVLWWLSMLAIMEARPRIRIFLYGT
jgi:hypothetical protein